MTEKLIKNEELYDNNVIDLVTLIPSGNNVIDLVTVIPGYNPRDGCTKEENEAYYSGNYHFEAKPTVFEKIKRWFKSC